MFIYTLILGGIPKAADLLHSIFLAQNIMVRTIGSKRLKKRFQKD